MKTIDFEKKIQEEIDKDLSIRTNPNHEDIAGVYWNDIYLGIAVPPVEIRDRMSSEYVDAIGHQYKDQFIAYELIKGKLPKYKKAMKEDPDLFKPVVMEKDLKIVNPDGTDPNQIKEI